MPSSYELPRNRTWHYCFRKVVGRFDDPRRARAQLATEIAPAIAIICACDSNAVLIRTRTEETIKEVHMFVDIESERPSPVDFERALNEFKEMALSLDWRPLQTVPEDYYAL
jgi:hypothetical protein